MEVLEQPDTATSKIETAIFNAPLWKLCGAALAVTVALFGYAPQPSAGLFALIGRDPFVVVETVNPWIYSSPVGPLLYWALGITSTAGVAHVGAALNLAALASIAYVVRAHCGDLAARLVVVAFFCSPLANLSVTWLGTTDMLTVLAATALVVGSTTGAGAAGALLGFNHFEQGSLIAVLALILRWKRGDPEVRSRAAMTVGGMLVGRFTLFAYHSGIGADVGSSRLDFVRDVGVRGMAEATLTDAPTVLFSVLGVLWAALGYIVYQREPMRWWLVGGVALMAVPTFVTFDMTRVFALLTWPVVVVAALWFADNEPVRVRRWVPWLCAAAIFVPRVIVWSAGTYVSSWARALRFWF